MLLSLLNCQFQPPRITADESMPPAATATLQSISVSLLSTCLFVPKRDDSSASKEFHSDVADVRIADQQGADMFGCGA